jgi:cytochrome c peroxidase
MRNIILGGLMLAASASAASASDIYVDQVHQHFSKTALTVKPGDTVYFKNEDAVTHDIRITAPDGSVNDRGLQKPGVDIVYTFKSPGVYHVGCGIHPSMKLIVTVK